jgi:hypothetical protein
VVSEGEEERRASFVFQDGIRGQREGVMRRAWRVGVALVLTLAALAGGAARAQRPVEGEKYAVLVGVRVYDPAEPLPTLTYPEDDWTSWPGFSSPRGTSARTSS